MLDYLYLIIGGGMTAAAALSSIRKLDSEGTIGLISSEQQPPYDRPPLSKGLWKGRPIERIWRKVDYPGVDLHLGRTVINLDTREKRVTDDRGTTYTYGKLLLATGGAPVRLPFGGDKILYFRTLDDYRQLREQTSHKHRFAVIGGGFIGSEIAAALTIDKQSVAIVFPESGIGARVYPPDVSNFLNDYYRGKGVEVHTGESINGLEQRGAQLALLTNSGKAIVADAVIAGIGIRPSISLAEAAGLKVDNGIVVDEFLRTSQPEIYAAGDVANFFNPLLGKRLRVEHEDNANRMGEMAGRNMVASVTNAEPARYDYLPFFYSDLFELGYEGVGEFNPQYEVIADWVEPYRKGALYYLKEKRVRGVLLWNTWGEMDAARDLIAEPGPFDAQDLIGRLTSRI
jgi:3-phenylpropionate/trans-cinnamate dioxygenase ferredoxin reductase component